MRNLIMRARNVCKAPHVYVHTIYIVEKFFIYHLLHSTNTTSMKDVFNQDTHIYYNLCALHVREFSYSFDHSNNNNNNSNMYHIISFIVCSTDGIY